APLRRTLIPLSPPAEPSAALRSDATRPGAASMVDTSQAPAGSPLAAMDQEMARIAWQYFAANQQSNTGMFNAVHNYPFTTLWDLGSALAGLVAAEQLGLLDSGQFATDLGLLLDTLAVLPLYHQELPNREYDTRTGRMVDVKGRPSNIGSGWSTLD